MELQQTKQGFQNICMLEYPVAEGTNVFDEIAIYRQKKASIARLVEDAINSFQELHEHFPTVVYMHGAESGILRSVLQGRRVDWETDHNLPESPKVDSYGDYEFGGITIKEGCNMQRGMVLLIYWEHNE